MPRATPTDLRDRTAGVKDVGSDPEDLLGILVSAVNPDGTSFLLPVEATPKLATLTDVDAGAANTAVASVLPAQGAGIRCCLTHIEVSFSAAPSSAPVLTVESPDNTVLLHRLLSSQAPAAIDFAVPLGGGLNQDLRVEIPAAGVGVTTHLSIAGFAL